MRQIFPITNNDNNNIIQNEDAGFVTNVEFTRLVAKFDELVQSFQVLQDNFDSLKTEFGESITTGNLNANTGNIAEIISQTIEVKNSLSAGTITAAEIKALTNVITDYLEAVNAQFKQINVLETVTADSINAINATVSMITAETAEIKNWTINNLNIDNAEINTLQSKDTTSETITTNSLDSQSITTNTANITEIENEQLVSKDIDSFQIKSSQIIWKESQDVIDNDRFFIEVPHFENGQYYLKAIAEDDTTAFSIEIFNSVDNFFIRWSQDIVGYIERVFITTNEGMIVFRIYNLEAKKLKLLFANMSSTNVGAPNTYETYNKPTRAIYIVEYKDGSKFFKPVDLYNDGVSVGTLTLDKTDNYNTVTDDITTYDTTSNERYTSYKPDQSVNTLDNVKFNSVEAPILNIHNVDVENRIKTPNIYNGPALDDLSVLNDDTLYIPNKSETLYTPWGFSIENICEYTDSWQDACKGYDWTRTTYKGEDLQFSKVENKTEITDYDVYHIASFENKYYLVYGNTTTNVGNACFLNIDTNTGAISYTNKLDGADKQFWDTALANDPIAVADLEDYDTVWLGDGFGSYQLQLVYKNIKLFKGNNIPYIVSVDHNGTIYRKTTETTVDGDQTVTEPVLAELIPFNQDAQENYRENTPLTYDPETREITNEEDITITGNLTVESDAEFETSVHITNELYVEGQTTLTDAEIENADIKNLNVSSDAKIAGDLYVTGTTHTTDTEDVVATGDILTLRANNEIGLADGQVSGIVVNNYDGEKDLALVTDNEGTLRVGTGTGTQTEYENVLFDSKTNKWYEYTLVNDEIELGNEIAINGTVTAWTNRRIENTYTVYDSITATEIDKTSLVPLAGRDESENMTDQALMKWNGEKLIAQTIDTPKYSDLVLVSDVTEDEDGNKNVNYKWQRTLSSEQNMFDLCHPIGEVYTQYPWKKSAMELYNKKDIDDNYIIQSFWNVVREYDGAFFRAEGGLADPYQTEKEDKTRTRYYLIEDNRILINIPLSNEVRITPQTANSGNLPFGLDYYKIESFTRPDDTDPNFIMYFADGHQQSVAPTTQIYTYNVLLGTATQVFSPEVPFERTVSKLLVARPPESQTWARDSSSTTAKNVLIDYSLKHKDEYKFDSWNQFQDGTVNLWTAADGNPIYVNGIFAGDSEHLWNPWKKEINENGNVYYTLQEGQINPITGLETVLSIASAANPTDAQKIVEFYQTPNSNQITCTFADGHQTAYANTTTVYDRNVSLGQMIGLFENWTTSTYSIPMYYLKSQFQLQIASTASPTQAQIIDRFYRCNSTVDSTYDCLTYFTRGSTFGQITSWSGNFYKGTEIACNQQSLLAAQTFTQNKATKTFNVLQPTVSQTWMAVNTTVPPTNAQAIANISYNTNWCNVKTLDGKIASYSQDSWLYNFNPEDDTVQKICSWMLVQYKWTPYEGNVYIPTFSIPASVLTGIETDTNDITKAEYMPDTNEIKYFYNDADGNEQNLIFPIDTEFAYNGYNFTGYWILLDYDTATVSRTVYLPAIDTEENVNDDGGYATPFPYYQIGQTYPDSRIKINDSAISEANQIYKFWITDGYEGGQYLVCEFADKHLATYAYNQPIYCNATGYYFRAYMAEWDIQEAPYSVASWLPPAAVNGRPVSLQRTSSYIAPGGINDRYISRLYFMPGTNYQSYLVSDPNNYGAFRPYNVDSAGQPTFYLYYIDTGTLAYSLTWNSAITMVDSQNGDVEYYYPPETCWDGTPYVCTVSNTLTPTDAQIVAKVDPIEGSTNYNVEFRDGHSAVYGRDTNFYATCNDYNGLGTNYNYRIRPYGMVYSPDYLITEEDYTLYKPKEGITITTANTVTPTDVQKIESFGYAPEMNYMFWQQGNGNKQLFISRDRTWYYFADGDTTTTAVNMYTCNIQQITENIETVQNWQEQSVPNITGAGQWTSRGVWRQHWMTKGALKTIPRIGIGKENWAADHSDDNIENEAFGLDASGSNKAYGRRNEVAPNNYTIRIWERVEEEDYVEETE